MDARAGGMQAKASSPPRMRRASIGCGSACTVYSRQAASCTRFARVQSLCPCNPTHPHEGYTAKGGKLSYMALAMEREHTANSSLLMQAGAALADPQPMLARLVRGCIAMVFTACVPADQSSHHHADTVKGGEHTQLHGTGVDLRANHVQLATDAGRGGPGRRSADASSAGTRLYRYGLHCLRPR